MTACAESHSTRAGLDIVSYGELIDRIRHHMFVGRTTIASGI